MTSWGWGRSYQTTSAKPPKPKSPQQWGKPAHTEKDFAAHALTQPGIFQDLLEEMKGAQSRIEREQLP